MTWYIPKGQNSEWHGSILSCSLRCSESQLLIPWAVEQYREVNVPLLANTTMLWSPHWNLHGLCRFKLSHPIKESAHWWVLQLFGYSWPVQDSAWEVPSLTIFLPSAQPRKINTQLCAWPQEAEYLLSSGRTSNSLCQQSHALKYSSNDMEEFDTRCLL